jgi:hypothetical protein
MWRGGTWVALPGDLHFNFYTLSPEVQPPPCALVGQQAHDIAFPGVAQWRIELSTAFASSEVDDTDVAAGNAMQRGAEQAAHCRVEKVSVEVIAGTH